jgi:hypothetical protein
MRQNPIWWAVVDVPAILLLMSNILFQPNPVTMSGVGDDEEGRSSSQHRQPRSNMMNTSTQFNFSLIIT